MDVDAIEPGEDFVDVIQRSVAKCDIEIVVIGKSWLRAADQMGRRRIDNPEDFVRLEILSALERKIKLIPVLVGGATMPRSDELPEALAPLARRNAFDLSDKSFHSAVDRLIASLAKTLTSTYESRRQEDRIVAEEVERLERSIEGSGVSVPVESSPANANAKQQAFDMEDATRGEDCSCPLDLSFDEAVQGASKTVEFNGKKLKIIVPPGVDTGIRLRLKNEGALGRSGGAAGDLYVIVRVGNHPLFVRDDKDLYYRLRITSSDASRGVRVAIPKIGTRKPLTVEIPAGTAPGTRFRFRGAGVADPLDSSKIGDLYATVDVE